MSIILQCSGDQQNREFFRGSELIKFLVRYIQIEELSTSSLSSLINFTQDDHFTQQLIQINGLDRIIDLMTKTLQKSGEKLEEKQKLKLELSQLLLLNLSQVREARLKFLDHGDKDKEGRNFILFLNMFANKLDEVLKFFPNICANLSSEEECRQLIIKDLFLLVEKFVPFINDKRRVIRDGVLKTFRNCAFEYETEEFTKTLMNEKYQFAEKIILNIATQILVAKKIEGITEELREQLVRAIVAIYPDFEPSFLGDEKGSQ